MFNYTSRQKSDFFYQRHEYIGAKGYQPPQSKTKIFLSPQIQFLHKLTYPLFVTFLGVT